MSYKNSAREFLESLPDEQAREQQVALVKYMDTIMRDIIFDNRHISVDNPDFDDLVIAKAAEDIHANLKAFRAARKDGRK